MAKITAAISVIVPAFNEEQYLAAAINAILKSGRKLAEKHAVRTETVVVDNESTDNTAKIAENLGAVIVQESEHNIGRVRNTGARASSGQVIVFVDADTLAPEELLLRIYEEMEVKGCAGGAVDTLYLTQRLSMRVYLGLYRTLGRLLKMAQGATEFCSREMFERIGGYDETYFMGEDVDFYTRMRHSARLHGEQIITIRDIRVVPSTRRYDQWSLWRTLIWTNPLLAAIFKRRRSFWKGWYKGPPR